MSAVANELGTQSGLESAISRFYNYNNDYYTLLSRLEDKLHKILDKRKPDKLQGEPTTDKQQPDAITNLNTEASRLAAANTKFENLLSHLTEII